MYGLEKEPIARFEFDLEKNLKKDLSQTQMLIKASNEKIQEIKNHLRAGVSGKDLDQLGTLLHGYTALNKVLNRFLTKK